MMHLNFLVFQTVPLFAYPSQKEVGNINVNMNGVEVSMNKGDTSGARIGGKNSFLDVLGGEKEGINPPECPKKMPENFNSCSVDRSITCYYGEECCCGKCSFSFGLNCNGGNWWEYHTEFC